MNTLWQLFLESISLQTARGRLIVALIANIVIFSVPYHWLANLSLYKQLGIDSPTIGLTRAYWLLLHGHLAEAWSRNWLIFPVMAVAWSIVALDVYSILRRNKTADLQLSEDKD